MDTATVLAITLPTLFVLRGSLVSGRQAQTVRNELSFDISRLEGILLAKLGEMRR